MKKLISVLLAVLLLGGASASFAGCTKEDAANTLYIEVENAGYGVEWLDPLIDIFEAEHEGIKVKKTFLTKKANEIVDKVISGSTHLDLIFVESDYVLQNAEKQIVSNGVTYSSPFADLTTMYNTKIPGENQTIKEKMNPAYADYKQTVVNGESKYYVMPWMQSAVGIVINNKVYKAEYGKIPNTTDEMFTMFDNLIKKGVTPAIHALDTSYWGDAYIAWMAQYNGSENMKKFYQGYSLNAETSGQRYVPQMLLDDGLKAGLDVLEKLLLPANNYMHPDSQTLDFTMVQNKFLEGKDNILFMPNGAWLEREMEANYSPDELDIEFIKFPVVSALAEKLGLGMGTTADAKLSEIIDYIDGTVKEKPAVNSNKGLTQDEVIAAVKDAREMVPTNYGFSAAIPSYSTKIDLAKEFLQLIASNGGIEAMLKKCGSMAPFKYDIDASPVKDSLSPFMYSTIKMVQEGKYFFSQMDNLFIKGGLNLINGMDKVSILFGASNQADRKTANQVYVGNYEYASAMWQTYKQNAGITV